MLKPKNIIIFVAIGAVLILIYVFFIKGSSEPTGLVSTSVNQNGGIATTPTTGGDEALGARNFLSTLLNVRNIKLDDSIFSDVAFSTLHDSSIILTPDGTEGRPNPFAPIGIDKITQPTSPQNTSTNTGAAQPPSGSTSTPPSASSPSTN